MGDDGFNEGAGGEGPSEKVQSHSDDERDEAACFDPKNLVGATLDGRYELFECIGRGGMGVVYLATQSALDRDVVVKVLPPSFVDDKEALGRFEREARGMSRLQHPHIVSIYDFGYHDEQAYIVMEYVEGHTLRRIIKSGQGGELATFGSISLQILEGISEAHSLGMVHRDIKPANIMLTERRGQNNYVKILDFGLAKLVKGSTDVTKEQTLVGSVSYLAPEQIMGNDTDQRVDVYALGVLFYYMLAGEKPFSGDDDVAVLYQHVHNQPERLENKLGGADIPRSALELVHKALSKDPDNRPEDAGEFLDAMKRCLAGSDISAPHISGEFESLAGSGAFRAASPEDPSDKLDRERHETPIYQGSLDSHSHERTNPIRPTPTPTGVSGEQLSWVTGEHMLKVEKQNRLRNILLGMLGAFLVGGAGIFFYTNTVDRADDASSSEVEQAVPSEAGQPALPAEAQPAEVDPGETQLGEAEPAEAEPAEAESAKAESAKAESAEAEPAEAQRPEPTPSAAEEPAKTADKKDTAREEKKAAQRKEEKKRAAQRREEKKSTAKKAAAEKAASEERVATQKEQPQEDEDDDLFLDEEAEDSSADDAPDDLLPASDGESDDDGLLLD